VTRTYQHVVRSHLEFFLTKTFRIKFDMKKTSSRSNSVSAKLLSGVAHCRRVQVYAICLLNDFSHGTCIREIKIRCESIVISCFNGEGFSGLSLVIR